ncbi:MAG: Hpt domain-containing protein [Gallionella sp.]|nr:Hpt domain-containing protein [Gallionella sp.]
MSKFIIDVQQGIDNTFGMVDLWRRAISTLMTEFPGLLANIESAFAEQRFADMQFHVHKLLGTVLHCGTPMLHEAIQALELACINTPDRIEDCLGELKAAFDTLESFVDEHGIPEVEDVLPIECGQQEM